MVPSPFVPGRSLPAVVGCKWYPSVFCILQFGRGMREVHHVGLCESRRREFSVVVEVVAAAARESSHYTPLAFMTRLLGPLRPLMPQVHPCILHGPPIPAPIAYARSLARVHFWTSLSSIIPSCSFLSVILLPLGSPRGSTSFKSDRRKTFCDRSARGL